MSCILEYFVVYLLCVYICSAGCVELPIVLLYLLRCLVYHMLSKTRRNSRSLQRVIAYTWYLLYFDAWCITCWGISARFAGGVRFHTVVFLIQYILHKDKTLNTRERFLVKLSINNHIVGLLILHKKHIMRTCLMYHAACKVEFQPFKRSYSQLTFFN